MKILPAVFFFYVLLVEKKKYWKVIGLNIFTTCRIYLFIVFALLRKNTDLKNNLSVKKSCFVSSNFSVYLKVFRI